MEQSSWKGFSLGDLKIPLPVVQGGMGVGVSLSRLAAAVANEGGIGVLSAAGIGMLRHPQEKGSPESNARSLAEEIQLARSMTNGVLGVNIMVALSDFSTLVRTAVSEGIDVIFAGAGLPLDLPALAGDCATKLVPIVSSHRAVKTISRWWRDKYGRCPDGFVVEGPKAGGHLGFKPEQIDDPAYQLEAILPPVLEEVSRWEAEWGRSIPVIAAGGIFDGQDVHRILSLGAAAVQMGTRFVATEECDADPAFKEAYVRCTQQDITLIKSPVGLPGRAIRGEFLQQAAAGEKHPKVCPFHCISTCKKEKAPYCISLALLAACKGRMEQGFAFIGANGWRVEEITTVGELICRLGREYDLAAAR